VCFNYSMRSFLFASLFASASILAACSADSSNSASGEDEIVSSKTSDHWFYGGPLPELENPSATASLKGHTVRVTGFLPAGFRIPELPHVKTKQEGGRTRIDAVYPIATARPGKSNARPGTHDFDAVRAYRPNGIAVTQEEGEHFVTWGGFPFLAYQGGIAFHGPITDRDNEAPGDMNVWFLKRGTVSGGCNRMMGEHVVELVHLLGIDMTQVYKENDPIRPTTTAKLTLLADYDKYEGKFVDVDYPTDVGVTRPGKVHGVENVVMFGSWVASETPDGKDLPPDMKFEGGVDGVLYDFQNHAQRGWVCSMPKSSLPELRDIQRRLGGSLPDDFCARKLACDAARGRICKGGEIGL
jgi:hypothetical protein